LVPSQAQALMSLSKRIRARICPVATSQIRTVRSSPPEASQQPSGAELIAFLKDRKSEQDEAHTAPLIARVRTALR